MTHAKNSTSYHCSNLHSFGRSSTLDRKLKPLNLTNERSFSASKPAESDAGYIHNFNHKPFNDASVQNQRNSLNLQLKSPSGQSSYSTNQTAYANSNGSFLRRPLSHENYDTNSDSVKPPSSTQLFQRNQGNDLDKNQHIFNINNHVSGLTNQLNQSVSDFFKFRLKRFHKIVYTD